MCEWWIQLNLNHFLSQLRGIISVSDKRIIETPYILSDDKSN